MKYILLFILPIFQISCKDGEDTLIPSNIDQNWLVVNDNPNDEVDHLRYLLFNEFNVPIFYNDTLGKSETILPHGGTYIHYEILKTFYLPSSLEGNLSNGYFSLCPKVRKQELLPALKMLKSTILPRLSEEMLISSILLTDTLLLSKTGIGKGSPVTNHKGFNTWIIGNIFKIGELTEREREVYGINLLINMVQNNNTSLHEKFSNVYTEKFWTKYSASSEMKYHYPMGNGTDNEILSGMPFAINVAEIYTRTRLEIDAPGVYYPKEKMTDLDYLNLPEDLCLESIGFLHPMRAGKPGEPKYLLLIPNQSTDYHDFCHALFEYTPTEFRAKYAAYPVVLEKYEVVKQGFEEYGFTFE